MNKNINLYEILKGHENEVFYSTVYGEVKISFTPYLVMETLDLEYRLPLSQNGTLKEFQDKGEIIIFPSKDQRDWNKWIEEQKSKGPKIYGCNTFTDRTENNSQIEKSALALLKIHQLIEVGYGGNISYEEWKLNTIKYIIDCNKNNFYITPCNNVIHHIAFHSKEQAEEFLKYPKNIQLLKDYFMI